MRDMQQFKWHNHGWQIVLSTVLVHIAILSHTDAHTGHFKSLPLRTHFCADKSCKLPGNKSDPDSDAEEQSFNFEPLPNVWTLHPISSAESSHHLVNVGEGQIKVVLEQHLLCSNIFLIMSISYSIFLSLMTKTRRHLNSFSLFSLSQLFPHLQWALDLFFGRKYPKKINRLRRRLCEAEG